MINGETMLDGDLGAWVERPPEFITNAIKQGARPQPHMQAVMIALTGAVLSEKDVSIEAWTSDHGWRLSVSDQLMLTG